MKHYPPGLVKHAIKWHQADGKDPQILKGGLDANKPAAGKAGRIYFAVDTHIFYYDNGVAWEKAGIVDYPDLDEIPSSFTPSAHKTTHQDGGTDEINVAGLSGLLADAQTPSAHKTTHQNGGADEINLTGLSGVSAEDEDTAKSATDVSTTGTSLANATGLSFTAAANTDYLFEFFVRYRHDVTSGIALAVNGPASPSSIVLMKEIPEGVLAAAHQMSRAYNVYQASGAGDANLDCIATVRGILRNGANSGTFILRFASGSASGTVTIKAGSILRYRKV